MKKFILALAISLAAAVPSAVAGDIDYTQGVIFINEDWYGHQNSTVNYLLPDEPGGDYWHYRVVQSENPGMELGCTAQHGAVWNGRLYIVAKQEKDPGATVTGGRLTVLDASTMKIIEQLQLIDPSGRQCDGRAFLGVDEHKGYVSTSNGIWRLNLATLEIEGQVEGTANPNVGDDKPVSDPTSSLYYGQTGTMVLAAGRVFAVHQQYGLLVIDPETDKVTDVLDMDIVNEAVEADTGEAPRRSAGIGSTIVRAADGSLWHSVAKNVQGSGSTYPYIVRVDPATLQREIVKIEGADIYPPANSWYAWTPDPFCASETSNTLYWCGGQNSWFTNYRVFRFDVDTRTTELLIDFNKLDGDWHIYGCSLGVHPVSGELYMSLFHKFADPIYITRRYSAGGELVMEYPMISNYWFPSLPVFPQSRYTADVPVEANDGGECEVFNLAGVRVAVCADTQNLRPGIYIRRSASGRTSKFVVR